MFDNVWVQAVFAVLMTFLIQLIGRHSIEVVVRKSVKQAPDETKEDEKKRENTLIAILRTTFVAVLWLTTLIIILTLFGVNVMALLTGAGIIGVFFGLSAQNTVKDILAGMFLLFEKQYRVGDTVNFAGGSTGFPGTTGKVEEITLRITKLRDLGGNLVTVRNGEPAVITNKTFSFASTVFDFVVTYDSDIKEVEKMLNAVGEELAADTEWQEFFRSPIHFQRIDDFGEKGVVVRAIGTVTPSSQWKVAGEYRKRLLVAARKNTKVNFAHS